jgi:hypothetical protein
MAQTGDQSHGRLPTATNDADYTWDSEAAARRIRPAEASGQPIGDLLYDPAEGEASGAAAGVERRLFNQVVVAIMRAYRRTGSAPTTAHAYYY